MGTNEAGEILAYGAVIKVVCDYLKGILGIEGRQVQLLVLIVSLTVAFVDVLINESLTLKNGAGAVLSGFAQASIAYSAHYLPKTLSESAPASPLPAPYAGDRVEDDQIPQTPQIGRRIGEK